MTGAGKPWSGGEVALTVESCLRILKLELAGQPYNKSEASRASPRPFPGRNGVPASERQRRSSASNYRRILADVVIESLARDSAVERATQLLLDDIDQRACGLGGAPDVVAAPNA